MGLTRSVALSYAVAVLGIAVATLLRELFDPLLGNQFPFATVFLAVLVAGWYGGFGPALAATILGGASSAFFLLPPRGSLSVAGFEYQAGLALYSCVGLSIAVLSGATHRARVLAEANAVRATLKQEEFRITLASIGDAVIATDAAGRVVMMNALAEKLTGWSHDAAAGRPLDSVFRIVNERTRQPADNPVAKVLSQGTIVGLANHTVLIARDGMEHPIDDSAAPIRSSEGDLVGVVLVFRDVSEQRRAAAVQRRLAAIVESSDDAIISKDLNGIITSWNAGAERIYGYAADEVVGKPFTVLVPAERSDEARDAARRLLEGERLEHFETVRQRKDGSQIHVSVSYSPIRDEEGHLFGTAVIARDITDLKRAEATALERQQQLQLVYDIAPVFIAQIGRDRRYKFVNRSYARRFDLEPQDIVGRTIADVIGPEAYESLVPFIERVLAGERVVFASEVPYRDLGSMHMRAAYEPEFDADGRVTGYVLAVVDVTGSKRTEQALRDSEERLRIALEAGRMGVWDWNIRTNAVKWSENLEVIHGLPPGGFGGTLQAVQDLIHPEDRDRVGQAIRRCLEHREEYDIEFRNVWPDGSVHWTAARGTVLREGDEPVRMLGVCTDITARKRAEMDTQFLADASATLATLVDYESTLQKIARLSVPHFADWCAVDMLDPGGSLRRLAVAHVDPTKVTLAHELYRRYPPDPAESQGVWNIIRTGRSEMIPEIDDAVLAERVKDAELLKIIRALGLRSYMGVPLSVRGQVLGVLTFIAAESGRRYDDHDLAAAEDLAHRAAVAIENSRLYQELREADRTKDDFLALLAHELRNPLAPIRNALHILQLSGNNPAVVEQAREVADRQVHSLTRMVDDLLDVSRILRGKVELRTETVELGKIIAQAVETARPAIDGGRHELTVELSPEPMYVTGDVVRLAQVVSNLLHNSTKYSNPGGKIVVRVERDDCQAVIRVRDTGIGIAPEKLHSVFEPFMQVEATGQKSQGGLGIGLTVVQNIIALHGGTVEARSDGLGMGSEFIVRLPMAGPADVDNFTRTLMNADPPGRPEPRKILVTDDNVDAAESLAMLLRLEGHEVRVAHDGPTALQLAEAEPPELVFLDLGMPRMDGYQVAQCLRSHPSLSSMQLVALTGWGSPEDRRRTKEAGFDHHLVKPVAPEDLRRLLVPSGSPPQ